MAKVRAAALNATATAVTDVNRASAATGAANRKGKQAADNAKLRDIAERLGISVRAAKRYRAKSAAKGKRRVTNATNGRRDAAAIRARLGMVRADGSLQHIGGVAVNAARRANAESAEKRLFDDILKVDAPALEKWLRAATAKAGKAASRKAALTPTQSHPSSVPTASAAAADQLAAAAYQAAVTTATPDVTKGWRRYLAAVILADKSRGRSGYGAFKRALKKLADNPAQLPADLAAGMAAAADDADANPAPPKRRRRRTAQGVGGGGVTHTSTAAAGAAKVAARSAAAAARADRFVGTKTARGNARR